MAIHELPLQYATVAAGLVPALIIFYALNRYEVILYNLARIYVIV